MANRRDLKKEIKFLADELVSSICVKSIISEQNDDKASELIVKIIAFRDRSVRKVSSYNREDNGKSQFRDILKEVGEEYNELIKEYDSLKLV
ncbi:MAG: hypothetical protein HUJ96_07260 [Marinilabiliaceae bacterium]|nr:hypothetical protein [Marinilabiliaceae bacterium]